MMYRHLQMILIVSLLFLGYGCADKYPPIDEVKMRAILWDMHIAEVKVALDDSSKNMSKNKDIAKLEKEYNAIFAHYQINKETFDKALDWYFKNPETFDSMYKMMIAHTDSLETQAGKVELNEKNPKESDTANLQQMKEEQQSMKDVPRVQNNDSSIKAPQRMRPEKLNEPK